MNVYAIRMLKTQYLCYIFLKAAAAAAATTTTRTTTKGQFLYFFLPINTRVVPEKREHVG